MQGICRIFVRGGGWGNEYVREMINVIGRGSPQRDDQTGGKRWKSFKVNVVYY